MAHRCIPASFAATTSDSKASAWSITLAGQAAEGKIYMFLHSSEKRAENAQASRITSVQKEEKEKKTKARKKRLLLDISPELHREVKVRAAQKDMSIREFVVQALEKELRKG
ncbi:MAG: toxin-antitoxin system HicB family antitoxin [Deltaproteobacteria bacterium]|nr:toxin-antitoxin system HicB family antitoxin [Deltaproteobacteria bacterium]